jgi:simple sugar transport system permease protein
VLQAPGSAQPKSADILSTALMFPLFGSQYGVNIGFVLAIAETVYCWWLLNRSSLGFKFRAIGENPKAARVAGMDVNRLIVYVFVISGALLGRSRPWGVFAAGILFGIVDAGGYAMQAANNVDINIVTVLQAVIVLFIAAPPLVRAIFRLPAPGSKRKVRTPRIQREAVAK